MERTGTVARSAAGAIACVAWGAILGQLALNFGNAPAEGKPLWLVPLQLYGYFTLWANTLVALVAMRFALARRGGDVLGRRGGGVLGRPGTLAATMVYIVVVGVIYNALLSGFRHLEGVPKLIDNLLHVVVPLAYPLWWLVCVRRGLLGWGSLVPALGFPLAYCLVAMGRGLLTGKYAYFFIDIGKYGVPQVLLNIGGLVLLYAGLMAAVIAFDRWAARGAAPAPAS